MQVVQLDVDKLRADLRVSALVSAGGLILPFGASLAVAALFMNDAYTNTSYIILAVFLTVVLGISALPVLARILSERRMLNTRLGGLSMAIAAVDDVIAWCLLAVVIAVSRSTNSLEILWTFLLALAELFIIAYVVRPLLKLLVRRSQGSTHVSAETFLILAIILVECSWFAEVIGLSALIGAFQVGLAIPRTSTLSHQLSERLEYFVVTILMPLFFTNSGLKTQFGLINDLHTAGFSVLLIVVATISKILGVYVPLRMTKSPPHTSMTIAVLMSCKGLVALVAVNLAKDYDIISDTFFAMLVLMVVVTTFLTVPLLQLTDCCMKRWRDGEEEGAVAAATKPLAVGASPATGIEGGLKSSYDTSVVGAVTVQAAAEAMAAADGALQVPLPSALQPPYRRARAPTADAVRLDRKPSFSPQFGAAQAPLVPNEAIIIAVRTGSSTLDVTGGAPGSAALRARHQSRASSLGSEHDIVHLARTVSQRAGGVGGGSVAVTREPSAVEVNAAAAASSSSPAHTAPGSAAASRPRSPLHGPVAGGSGFVVPPLPDAAPPAAAAVASILRRISTHFNLASAEIRGRAATATTALALETHDTMFLPPAALDVSAGAGAGNGTVTSAASTVMTAADGRLAAAFATRRGRARQTVRPRKLPAPAQLHVMVAVGDTQPASALIAAANMFPTYTVAMPLDEDHAANVTQYATPGAEVRAATATRGKALAASGGDGSGAQAADSELARMVTRYVSQEHVEGAGGAATAGFNTRFTLCWAQVGVDLPSVYMSSVTTVADLRDTALVLAVERSRMRLEVGPEAIELSTFPSSNVIADTCNEAERVNADVVIMSSRELMDSSLLASADENSTAALVRRGLRAAPVCPTGILFDFGNVYAVSRVLVAEMEGSHTADAALNLLAHSDVDVLLLRIPEPSQSRNELPGRRRRSSEAPEPARRGSVGDGDDEGARAGATVARAGAGSSGGGGNATAATGSLAASGRTAPPPPPPQPATAASGVAARSAPPAPPPPLFPPRFRGTALLPTVDEGANVQETVVPGTDAAIELAAIAAQVAAAAAADATPQTTMSKDPEENEADSVRESETEATALEKQPGSDALVLCAKAAGAPEPAPAPSAAGECGLDGADFTHVDGSGNVTEDEADNERADEEAASAADMLLAVHPRAQEAFLAQHASLGMAVESALRATPHAYSLVVLGSSLPREFGSGEEALAAAEPLVQQLADALATCATMRVSALVVFGPADA